MHTDKIHTHIHHTHIADTPSDKDTDTDDDTNSKRTDSALICNQGFLSTNSWHFERELRIVLKRNFAIDYIFTPVAGLNLLR